MGYWLVWPTWLDIGQALFFLRVFVEIHKLAKDEQGQYQAIVTQQAWSVKDLSCGFRGNFSCGTWWVVPSGQDSFILLN